MRYFLYYNQDSIDSILAQIEQGLLLKHESSTGHDNSTSNTQEIIANITGDLTAKVLGIGASLQGDLKGSNSDTETATRMVRSVQEKALHDYAFDKIYEYLTSNSLIKDSDFSIGDIVLLKEESTYLDFNYFQSLFADNGAVKLVNEQNKKALNEQLSTLQKSIPKGKTMPELVKIQIKEIENQVKNAEPERKEMGKTIEAIRSTLPYDRFVTTGTFLVPITDKYLRDDPSIVAFKYGGIMSIFGYITNIIDSTEEKTHLNDFAPLYDSVNKIMLTMFKNKERIYILHPIAMYY